MADYKELLRRAISALPENNGAARRAVYEKARSALVGQLRAIQPPLAARDITQHRLQLEDCIRQVEQEASEAVINLGREGVLAARPAPVVPEPQPARPTPPADPVPAPDEPPVQPEPGGAIDDAAADEAVKPEPPVDKPAPVPDEPAKTKSIEDLISEAAETSGIEITHVDTPAAETAAEDIPPAGGEPLYRPEPAPAPSFFSPRRQPAPFEPAANAGSISVPPRIEPGLGSTALARQPVAEPVLIEPPLPVEPALSAIREVEVEGHEAREAEGAIERAIETLDREARGEATAPLPETEAQPDLIGGGERGDETGFAAAEATTRPGAGLTIFLIVFALLLAGVGGAGLWAWREGYVDLDQMFGRGDAGITETAQTSDQPALPTLDANPADPMTDVEGAAGPGNTATTTASEPTSALEGLEPDDRLEPTPEAVTPTGTESVLPSIGTGESKTEERLSGQDTTIGAASDPSASVDPINLAGNQSLLLEASTDGQSGAVPFSGTVDWTEGVDDIGLPTLEGRASIPARNLDVSITIRKNSDPILPASHLMEISFDVPDTFMGGSIATLAGVLLKDEELVPGTALSGAAARVVGNSFLFALNASPSDVAANSELLQSRRWMDLAVIYGTGRNAILTLEKDEEAQVLFDRALAAWAQ
ncbi:hypothetical protein O9Z70_12580 [Devosia sp. YIM 151766]|uniref:hypothetical protein n=1 Tax=Devosia sp. YIM 151766 TaxID=3017325 RepID=UPI00255CAE76|nr:hypothetical protein [Devosia sp. YIM 151766]WIY52291.1 hypothetical protein O9Z70_12580 [Devosia sp. YIM 151766]